MHKPHWNSSCREFMLSSCRIWELQTRQIELRLRTGKKDEEGERWNMWRRRRTASGPWGDGQLEEDVGREVYLRRLSRRGAALTTRPFGWELFIGPKVEATEKEAGEMLSGSQAWASCRETWWQCLKDGLANEQWGMSAGTGCWAEIEIAMYVSACAENSRVFFLVP